MEKVREKKRGRSAGEQPEAGRSDENQDDRRLSSRVKKPKRVYDPSDKLEPYKQIHIEDLTKSPSKMKSPPHITDLPTKKTGPVKTILDFTGRKCLKCGEDAEGQPSVICQACGDCYHCLCHNPRVGKTTRKATWKCVTCKDKEFEQQASGESEGAKEESEKRSKSGSVTSTKRSSIRTDNVKEEDDMASRRTSTGSHFSFPSDEDDVRETKESIESLKENGKHDDYLIDDPATGLKFNLQKAKQMFKTSANNNPNFDLVPDCSKWTCQQVYEHFNLFFAKEAHIFKEQEIDGASLLLMTRSDMFKFNLKLGPALNMYRHVVMLQTRSLDPRKTWK